MGALTPEDRQMLEQATEKARQRMSGRTIDETGRDITPEHCRITEHLWLQVDANGVLETVWLPIGIIPDRPAENLKRERTRWLLRNPGASE